MFWSGNHRWDARTVFSDDPLVCGDTPPRLRDDPKFPRSVLQAKIYGSVEALERIKIVRRRDSADEPAAD
jgi:hypothetical protein